MSRTIVLEEYAKRRSRRIELVKKYSITALFLLPFLTAFIVFFVFPLFYGIYISLTNFNYSKPGAETFNQLHWFKLLLSKSYAEANRLPSYHNNFWQSFSHTLIFSAIMVPVAVLLPLGLAILINKKPPGFKLFRALIYMPSIIPLTAAGTIFTMLFMRESYGGFLATFFGVDIDWFNAFFTISDKRVYYAWIPIFFMCLWGGWGGNFIILSAGLQNVPKHLYEAAAIDGCSAWKRVMNITIPGIKPQLVLCLFTTIIGYLGLYGQNYVLTSGGPQATTVPGSGETSTIMYYIQAIVTNDTYKTKMYGLAAAASLIYAAFVGAFSGIQMYLTREKKTGTKISEAYNKWHTIK